MCCCCGGGGGGGGGGAVHVSSVAVSVVFAEGGAELVVGVVVLLMNLRVEVLSSVLLEVYVYNCGASHRGVFSGKYCLHIVNWS